MAAIDVELLDAAVKVAQPAAWAMCHHEDTADCWTDCSDIASAIAAAYPIIFAAVERATAHAIADAIDREDDRRANRDGTWLTANRAAGIARSFSTAVA